MAKLNELKKVELLEKTVLSGSTERVKAVFAQYAPFEFTARALGLACRFVGAEMVKCLTELGVSFEYEFKTALITKYHCRLKLSNSVSIPMDYRCCVLAQEYGWHMEDAPKFSSYTLLNEEERVRIVQAMCENAQVLHVDVQELLYYAALTGDTGIFYAMKAAGAHGFSEYRRGLLSGELKHNFLDMEGRFHREEIMDAFSRADAGGIVMIIEMLADGMENTSIRLGRNAFYRYDFSKSRDVFIDSCCCEAAFMRFIRHTNLLERVKPKELLDGLIVHSNAEGLEWAFSQGWVSKNEDYKRLLEFAVKAEASPAVVACILKHHTPEAGKASSKIADEFGLELKEPTAAELKKLWGTRKNEDGTLTVISYKGNELNVIVPEKIGKAQVTALDSGVFNLYAPRLTDEQIAARRAIRSVEIPGSIRELPENLFDSGMYGDPRSALEEVILNEGLERIGKNAFCNCIGVKGIRLPQSLKEISCSAFRGCKALEEIVIPDGVETIDVQAFGNCTSLKEITLSKKLKKLERGAFANCMQLKQIELPKGIRRLSGYVFQGWSVEEYIVPDQITHIGEFAFAGCTRLKKITLNEGLKEIEEGAFAGCSFEEIVIPSGVKKIGKYAFQGCGNLQRIVMDESSVMIGEGAFADCKKLQDEKGLIVVSGVLHGFSGDKSQPLCLPDKVKTVEKEIFRNLPPVVYRAGGAEGSVPELSVLNVGDEVEFGRFPQDLSFEMKPLMWQVIAQDGGRRLLLAKQGIISFREDGQLKELFKLPDGKEWKKSGSRAWLNSVFFNAAFSEAEQARICESLLKNPGNKKTKPVIKAEEDTLDRVFLLSFEEFMQYVNEGKMCQASVTPYAEAQYEAKRRSYFYLLRTPGTYGFVCVNGLLGECTMTGNHVGISTLRPAMWVE